MHNSYLSKEILAEIWKDSNFSSAKEMMVENHHLLTDHCMLETVVKLFERLIKYRLEEVISATYETTKASEITT